MRLPRPVPLTASPALVTLGVAAVLIATAFVQGAGSSLGPKTITEIGLLLVGGALVVTALLRAPGGAGVGLVPVALLAVFAGLSALSIAWAVNPSESWLVANQMFAYLAVFAGAVALATLVPERWPSVIGGVVLALVVICGYGLLTKALPEQLNEVELFARLREPFGYWNAVGLAGALAVPACLWLGSRRDGSPFLSALAYPALAVCVSAMLMAYSRGALLAAAIGTALWFILTPLRLRGATVLLVGGAGGALIGVWSFGQDALTTDRAELAARSTAGLELTVLAVAVLLVVLVAGLAAGFVADLRSMDGRTRRRIGIGLIVAAALTPFAAAGVLATSDAGLKGSIDDALSSLTDTSAVGPANDPSRLTATGSVRSRYWAQGIDAWKSDKALGVGAGGYGTARLRYRKDLLDVRHAHGFVPETMAELGTVGLVVTLLLLAAWVVAVRRALTAARRAREHAGLVTLTAVAVVFGAHSLIDFTWTIPGVAVVGLLCAGWVAGRSGAATATAAAPRTRLLAAGGVAVLVLAAAWSTWQPLRSANAVDAGYAALDAGRAGEARDHMERARELNPLSVDPLLDLAAVERRERRYDAAEAAIEEATRVQPTSWLAWLRLADHRLFELKDPRGARDAIRVAIYLNPRSWDVAQRYIDISRKLRTRER